MNKKIKIILSIILLILILMGIIFIIYNKISNVSDVISNEDIIKISITDLFWWEKLIIFFMISIFIFMLLNLGRLVFNITSSHKLFIISLIISIILGLILTLVISYNINQYMSKHQRMASDKTSVIVLPKAKYELVTSKTINNTNFYYNKSDENVFLIKNGINVNISNSIITKAGSSKDIMLSKIYGVNAGILVLKDSKLTIDNSIVTTSSKGSIGLFSALTNSSIEANNVTIETSNNNSPCIGTSFNSSFIGNNLSLKTSLTSSEAIRCTNGSKVEITESDITTNATNSPFIYTDSEVSLLSSLGTSKTSMFAVINDNGYVNIRNSNLKAAGLEYEDEVGAGFLIRKVSNNSKKAKLSSYKSTLEIYDYIDDYHDIPLIYIKDNDADINIENTNINYSQNNFMVINNRNDVTLTTKNQSLIGNILFNNNGNLVFNLDMTNYKGIINSNKKGKVTLNIDNDSTITLTGNSYVSIINDEKESYNNIITNGYTLYYDRKLNPKLNGKTIILDKGGKLEGI